MGLFNFFKKKPSAIKQLEKAWDNPETKLILLRQHGDKVLAQIANLKSVDRGDDVSKTFLGHINALNLLRKEDPYNDAYMTEMLRFAQQAGELQFAILFAEKVLKEQAEKIPTIDLTRVWYELGCIYHKLGDYDKEYWAFDMATKAQSPKGTKTPASRQLKALAHQMAYGIGRGGDAAHSEHERMRRQLAPEVDWDDSSQLLSFLRVALQGSASDARTEEVTETTSSKDSGGLFDDVWTGNTEDLASDIRLQRDWIQAERDFIKRDGHSQLPDADIKRCFQNWLEGIRNSEKECFKVKGRVYLLLDQVEVYESDRRGKDELEANAVTRVLITAKAAGLLIGILLRNPSFASKWRELAEKIPPSELCRSIENSKSGLKWLTQTQIAIVVLWLVVGLKAQVPPTETLLGRFWQLITEIYADLLDVPVLSVKSW
jgi:hypothetical protein